MFGALSRPVRPLPPKALAAAGSGVVAAEVSEVASSRAGSARLGGSRPGSAEVERGGRRLYEVVVQNCTGQRFELVGSTALAQRRVPEGRLLRVAASLASASALVSTPLKQSAPAFPPDQDQHVSCVVQAMFSRCAAKEDTLEFTVAYTDRAGEGFTVRVHAHERSPLRSDVVTIGHGAFDVESSVMEVPRLVARPPFGYAETSLGIYETPDRSERSRVGMLKPGEEVLAADGSLDLDSRWLRISSPMEGWVQAKTRDGRPMLADVVGRPHLRQVVVVRPREPATIVETTSADIVFDIHGIAHTESSLSRTLSPSRRLHAPDTCRATEHACYNSRIREQDRLGRKNAHLEGAALVGPHGRRAVLGVF